MCFAYLLELMSTYNICFVDNQENQSTESADGGGFLNFYSCEVISAETVYGE